jgi:hypothetical protein
MILNTIKYHYVIWTIESIKMNGPCLFESTVKLLKVIGDGWESDLESLWRVAANCGADILQLVRCKKSCLRPRSTGGEVFSHLVPFWAWNQCSGLFTKSSS